MVVITIDGVKCHQNTQRFDPMQLVIRDVDGAQTRLGPGSLTWRGSAGVLPDGVSTYGRFGGAVIVIDPIAGFDGRVAALAVARGAFAYVVRTK